MIQIEDKIKADIGHRYLHRLRDVFTPSVSVSVFDTLGVPTIYCLVDHGMVAEKCLTEMDLEPHDAFCHGRLPAHVYADWLEEKWPDVPALALRMLRGWMWRACPGSNGLNTQFSLRGRCCTARGRSAGSSAGSRRPRPRVGR